MKNISKILINPRITESSKRLADSPPLEGLGEAVSLPFREARGGCYTPWQTFALTFLRVLIGWHFLYEGLTKLYTPGWTAKEYLLGSVGPFAPVFKSMAKTESVLNVVDILNEWGLVLIGLSLFVGLFSKLFKLFGIVLLAFYYLAYPPFASLGINAHVEGSYWIVNKNLIEMAALFVLYLFPSSHITGIDRFLMRNNDMSFEKSNDV